MHGQIVQKVFIQERGCSFCNETASLPDAYYTRHLYTYVGKAKQYLHKRGSVILVASVIVWFLGYYPHHSEKLDALDKEISRIEQTEKDFSTKEQKIKELTAFRNLKQQENSYIGRIGHFISPVMKLLGFKKNTLFYSVL